jgi:hypothetical protein
MSPSTVPSPIQYQAAPTGGSPLTSRPSSVVTSDRGFDREPPRSVATSSLPDWRTKELWMKFGSEREWSSLILPRKVSEKIQTTLPSGSRTEFVVSPPVQSSRSALLSPYVWNSPLNESSGVAATDSAGSNEQTAAPRAAGVPEPATDAAVRRRAASVNRSAHRLARGRRGRS